jgi:hypothetical protein
MDGSLAPDPGPMLGVSWDQIIAIESWLEAALLHLPEVLFSLDFLSIFFSFFHLLDQSVLNRLPGAIGSDRERACVEPPRACGLVMFQQLGLECAVFFDILNLLLCLLHVTLKDLLCFWL